MNKFTFNAKSEAHKTRKFLILFLLFFFLSPIAAHAQVVKLKAYSFAAKSEDYYGNWTDWSDWEDCDVLIVIKNNEVITVYSSETQELDIIEQVDDYEDDSGGSNAEFRCVDEEGLHCGFRIGKQRDGAIQLYFEYGDLIYVYNVYVR